MLNCFLFQPGIGSNYINGTVITWKCLVLPGVTDTATFFSFNSALIVELFPTFGYPTCKKRGQQWWIFRRRIFTISINPKVNSVVIVYTKPNDYQSNDNFFSFHVVYCGGNVQENGLYCYHDTTQHLSLSRGPDVTLKTLP